MFIKYYLVHTALVFYHHQTIFLQDKTEFPAHIYREPPIAQDLAMLEKAKEPVNLLRLGSSDKGRYFNHRA
jgi:hypothetical protein